MKEERRLELEEKLNLAEAHGDSAEIEAIKRTIAQEYRLCTSHTAERLKRVEATVFRIEEGLIPATLFEELKEQIATVSQSVNSLSQEVEKWKNCAKGAKMLWHVLGYLAASGGTGLIVKLLIGADK